MAAMTSGLIVRVRSAAVAWAATTGSSSVT